MAVVQQQRRGTAAQHASFVGAQGEPTFDTTNKRLVVHDGVTIGGNPAARLDEVWRLLAASFGDANATITAAMRYVRLTAVLTAARTWTLPPVADVPEGQPITIVTGNSMVSAINKLIIGRNGTDTINGVATPFEITTPNTIVQFFRSGLTNWTVQVVGSTPDESITNAKLAPRGLSAILGRPVIGSPSGQVIDLTPSQVREIVGVYGAPRTITEAGAIAEADRGRLILAAGGAWTLSLAAAATLGAGFRFAILNTGAGVKTLDPAGAESIDGKATLVLQPGSYAELWCDGSNWVTSGQAIRSDSPQILTAAQLHQTADNAGLNSALRGFIDGLLISNNESNTVTVSAGVAVAGGCILRLAGPISKQLNAIFFPGNGNGGLETGAEAANTWYHVFLIGNQTSDAVDVLLSISLSPTLPSGFTVSRRIGSVFNNASSNLTPCVHDGDWFWWTSTQLPNDVAHTALGSSNGTLFSISVPPGLQVSACVNFWFADGVFSQVWLSSPDVPDLAVQATAGRADAPSSGGGGMKIIRTNASRQIRARGSTGASGQIYITTLGWRDSRGRDA